MGLFGIGIKTIGMLSIVLAVLLISLYLLRRFYYFKNLKKSNINMNIISTLHLSPKSRLDVVEISGKIIVLGVTPENINYITSLDKEQISYEKDI